jgi:hypothetical protein
VNVICCVQIKLVRNALRVWRGRAAAALTSFSRCYSVASHET